MFIYGWQIFYHVCVYVVVIVVIVLVIVVITVMLFGIILLYNNMQYVK